MGGRQPERPNFLSFEQKALQGPLQLSALVVAEAIQESRLVGHRQRRNLAEQCLATPREVQN